MNQPPFNNPKSPSTDYLNDGKGAPPAPTTPEETKLAQMRQEDARVAKQNLKRLYLILLVVGITLGAIVSVGIAIVLDRFNLSDPPVQVDQPSE